jgi:GT2 family glycosyltransferase
VKHPPGTIGFSVGDVVRYIEFVVSLQRMWRPDGTTTSYGQSVSIPENMNTIIRGMPDESKWLHIQSDDHIWQADLLQVLLDSGCDVVVPLIIRRGPPFIPVINKERTEAGSYHAFAYSEIPTSGLLEVDTAGSGGMLIRRHVLDAIEDPWFAPSPGSIGLDYDMNFCRKVREAGFAIYCDPGALLGHISNHTVWPEFRDGHWQVSMEFDQRRWPMYRVFSDEEEA